MSMSQWIKYRCDRVDDGGDWKQIVMFLRYQGVEFMSFLTALKRFLQGIPKKIAYYYMVQLTQVNHYLV